MTVDQVHELLEQQKLFHRELMEQQESNFKNFLTIVNEANNKRLDTMMKEISELRESLHYTQKDVDVLLAKEKVNHKTLTSFLPKIDYLDSQSRRNNIVIDGIPESENENWAESEKKVREIFDEKLKLTNMEFERVHRTGKSTGVRARPIVARFFRYKDKVRVM